MIIGTTTPNLYVVPAGEDMAGIDLLLVGKTARETVLKRCLEKTKLEGFDFVLIDTAPYISLLTVNALSASTHYIVPTTAEFLPLRGIEKLTQNVESTRALINPGLESLGVLITQYDIRKAITGQVESALKDMLGSNLFNTRIRVNTKFSSSPIDQQTIFQFEQHQGKGSEDYAAFTTEVLSRLRVKATSNEVVNG